MMFILISEYVSGTLAFWGMAGRVLMFGRNHAPAPLLDVADA